MGQNYRPAPPLHAFHSALDVNESLVVSLIK